MKEIFVYHGGTEQIENPICKFGRKSLDFGQGFYVTDILEQAITWGENIALVRNKAVVVNRYKLNREEILNNYRCKIFQYIKLNIKNIFVMVVLNQFLFCTQKLKK